MSPEQARYAARRAFGNITYTQEEVRSMWGFAPVGILIQDLRHALRNAAKESGFRRDRHLDSRPRHRREHRRLHRLDSVILKPLAFHDSGRLVAAWERVRFWR